MVPWRIQQVQALPGHALALTFADGVSGVIDLSGERFEGVFAPLADPDFFAQVRVADGVTVWPNGVDMAPDALYDEVVAKVTKGMNEQVTP